MKNGEKVVSLKKRLSAYHGARGEHDDTIARANRPFCWLAFVAVEKGEGELIINVG